jgi:hypothetical protein
MRCPSVVQATTSRMSHASRTRACIVECSRRSTLHNTEAHCSCKFAHGVREAKRSLCMKASDAYQVTGTPTRTGTGVPKHAHMQVVSQLSSCHQTLWTQHAGQGPSAPVMSNVAALPYRTTRTRPDDHKTFAVVQPSVVEDAIACHGGPHIMLRLWPLLQHYLTADYISQ